MCPITSTSGLGQRVGEEVACGEAQPLAELEASDVGIEDRLDRGQVESASCDVFVRQRDLNRHGALGAADVDHAAGDPARETWPRSPALRRRWRRSSRARTARAAPGPRRAPRRSLARLGLVLRGAGPQTLGQRSPESVQTGIRHLQEPTDVGGLGPVEKQVGRGRVAHSERPSMRSMRVSPARSSSASGATLLSGRITSPAARKTSSPRHSWPRPTSSWAARRATWPPTPRPMRRSRPRSASSPTTCRPLPCAARPTSPSTSSLRRSPSPGRS